VTRPDHKDEATVHQRQHHVQVRPERSAALAAAIVPDRNRVAALLTALALVLAVLVTGAATARPAGAGTVEDAFTNRLNDAREARGLPPLTTRGTLVAVARKQAARMASTSKLFHNPNLTSDVSSWRWVGENVGYGPDAAAVHSAFMRSPAHKANILDKDYTEVGIGVVSRGGRVWVAEVFREPIRVRTSSLESSRAAKGTVATLSHTLRIGDRGAAVKRLQARLGQTRTGYYGLYTKSAVARFQRQLGWSGKGNCGPKTWNRLF
jgi:uncharacterized protein YkwD